MKYEIKNGCATLYELEPFSLKDTLDCGQCFRWEENEDCSFSGVIYDKSVIITQKSDTQIVISPCAENDVSLWENYFDFARSYQCIKNEICSDSAIKNAVGFAGGIRILKQDSWEALCSFILSQNNNIKRIKGIVKRLCECFGEKLADGSYTFPSADMLAKLTPEDLAPIRCGFRARYVIDAAQKVSSGEIDLSALKTAPIAQARETLKTITGVGDKVAECVLLYGLNRLDAFPIDVWIRRALDEAYDGNLPNIKPQYLGIAQQYIFHYIRTYGKLKLS